nr:type III effector HopM1 [uncultured Pseudomonas sp.]
MEIIRSSTGPQTTTALSATTREQLQRPDARPAPAKPSNQPPLTTQQRLQAQQPPPRSQAQLFETLHPELRSLRAEFARLVQGQRPQNFSRPITPQARDARRIAQDPLQLNRQRMILEGRVLLLDPQLDFERMSTLLHADQPGQLITGIPYGDSVEHLLGEIDRHYSQPMPAGQAVCGEGLQALLDIALPRIARHLDGQAALYNEVLEHCSLNAEERRQVIAGREAFQALAQRWSADIKERILATCQALADASLQAAERDLRRARKMPDKAERDTQTAHAKAQVEQWRQVQAHFQDAFASVHDSALQDSLYRMDLEQHLQTLDEQNRGLFTSAQVFIAAAIPQGLASCLQFVLARAYVDPRLSLFDLARQSAASGAAVGAVHETLDNFIKPAAREMLASVGAHELRKVDPREVIPGPHRATTEGGRYREFNDAELQAASQPLEQARKGFINAQQDYYNGTLMGDGITFATQGGAQVVRRLLELTTTLPAAGVAAGMASSFMGGAAMSGLQALGQQNKHFDHDGRSLPTHVPERPPEANLDARLASVWSKGLSSADPRLPSSREAYTSKVYSASAAMMFFNGMGKAISRAGVDTTAAKAGSVLMTGIQAVGFLAPFYANKQSRDEAGLDDSSRLASAVENIRHPDREHLPHGTRPATNARTVENAYHRLRGLQQALPQAGVVATEALVSKTLSGLASLGEQVARQVNTRRERPAPVDIEMGENVGGQREREN